MDQLTITVGALNYFKSPRKVGPPLEFPPELIIKWYLDCSEEKPWLSHIEFEKSKA